MPVHPEHRARRQQIGFTLVETIVGIALFAVAMVFILTTYLPMLSNQSGPVYQIRAAELAQAMLHEALSRSFDENSDRSGETTDGKYRYCGEIDAANTAQEASSGSCSSTLGPDGSEKYSTFNDVDDFNAYCQQPLNGADFASAQGFDSSLYDNYSITVCVTQAPSLVGAASGRTDVAKMVTVTVTTPTGESLPFTAYRSNY